MGARNKQTWGRLRGSRDGLNLYVAPLHPLRHTTTIRTLLPAGHKRDCRCGYKADSVVGMAGRSDEGQ